MSAHCHVGTLPKAWFAVSVHQWTNKQVFIDTATIFLFDQPKSLIAETKSALSLFVSL